MSDHDPYDWRNYDLSDYPEEFAEEFKRILEVNRQHAARDPAEVAAEAKLPARRKFAPIQEAVAPTITKAFVYGEYGSFEELQGSAEVLFEPDPTDRVLQQAFAMFEEIAGDDEDVSHDLRYALTCLLTAALNGQTRSVYRQAAIEKATLRGLSARAEASATIIMRAQAIADELWGRDITRSIRVGDMADLVYARLLDEASAPSQVPELERVRKWIRNVAPAYAKRPGRPSGKS